MTTAPATRTRGPLGPWLGIVGGPVLWMVHLLGSSVFAGYVCGGSWGTFPLHALTIGCALPTAACIVASARAVRGSDVGESPVAAQRRRFMARLGTLIGAVSLFLILLEGVPNFFPVLCRFQA